MKFSVFGTRTLCSLISSEQTGTCVVGEATNEQDVSAHVAETMPDFLLIALGHVRAEAGRAWALADPREKESARVCEFRPFLRRYVQPATLRHRDQRKTGGQMPAATKMIQQGAWHV